MKSATIIHTIFSVDFDGCVSTILDELEIKEIR